MYEIDNSWKRSRVCHEVFMKDILECQQTAKKIGDSKDNVKFNIQIT